MEELVEQICDLMDEHSDYHLWVAETRVAYQNEVLRRVRNELDAREEVSQ